MAKGVSKDCNVFEKWLRDQGAEVLAPTNCYEFARFKAMNGTHVVYMKASGKISAQGFALTAYHAWQDGDRLDMGIVKFKRNSTSKKRGALLKRDGNKCFYCGLEMSLNHMTAEHLISRDKSGPNHLENMALAHGKCNALAANKPFMEKIRMRDRMRQPQEQAA